MSDRVYEIVAERICELLENGTVPWHQPWDPELGLPRSLSTGKLYRGVNVWLLGSSMYASPWWGTYKHITKRGGQVRKDERSTLVVFWKQTERMVRDAETGHGDETERKGSLLRYYRVFNAEQCDGLEVPEVHGAPMSASPSRPPRPSCRITSRATAPPGWSSAETVRPTRRASTSCGSRDWRRSRIQRSMRRWRSRPGYR